MAIFILQLLLLLLLLSDTSILKFVQLLGRARYRHLKAHTQQIFQHLKAHSWQVSQQ